MEDWERRYLTKLAIFCGAPWDTDPYSVRVSYGWEPGYAYSEYTMENAYFGISVSWMNPDTGLTGYRELRNEECVDFLAGLG
jgi:hypothetical protein